MWIQEVGPERQRGEAPGENAVELELDEGSDDVEELVHLLPGQVGQDLSEGSTDALNDHVFAEDDDEREDLVEHLRRRIIATLVHL